MHSWNTLGSILNIVPATRALLESILNNILATQNLIRWVTMESILNLKPATLNIKPAPDAFQMKADPGINTEHHTGNTEPHTGNQMPFR